MREQIQKQILEEVLAERKRQDEIWGDAQARNLGQPFWMTILGEEYGEACRAVLESTPENLREELIQLAATCTAFVEAMEPDAIKKEANS